jgi:hypothetical protein
VDEQLSFDTSVAHVARVYDYWLGGTDNFAADRVAGDQAIAAYPDIVFSVRANRAFLARTVRFLAADAGIRQFLDIGSGIPTANNTHEVARSVAPGTRVVYVDKDPIAAAHARALLSASPAGQTSYIDADARDTEQILNVAGGTLDFSRPVAIMLMAMLQHSYLALSHPASDIEAEAMGEMAQRLNKLMAEKVTFRGRAEVARFFDGLEMVEPGLVRVQEWRPSSEIEASSPAALWGGVGHKR